LLLGCDADRVDLIVRHGDQVYADDAFKASEKILKRHDIDDQKKNELILEAYKKIYRFTWNKDDVRRIYANCQHLMLWDDHELTNDWVSTSVLISTFAFRWYHSGDSDTND
jgi:phosphodiesterase/alkaline phosphatase D-like protein